MNIPTVDELIQGFERILETINPQQMIMLRANYHSGGRAATMRELATAAGYSDYKMANLQYGNLAKRLYKVIGLPKPISPRSGKGYWILGLGDFVSRHDFGLEMQCVMRPEVAKALERLGIVDTSVTPDELNDVEMMEDETLLSPQDPILQSARNPTPLTSHSIHESDVSEDSTLEMGDANGSELGRHDEQSQDQTDPKVLGQESSTQLAKRGTHHMLYWQERSVLDHAGNGVPLDVVASNGLFGVEPGDTLWIVTLNQEREFLLAGRLVVGDIVEHEDAIRRMPDAGLWQAEYYAFPEPETEEFLRLAPLQDIAVQLRFEGENDRLNIRDGQINPQQLREVRKLTSESAELITQIWEEFAPITDPEELLEAWQEVVDEQPDDPQARFNLGVALDEVDRSEDAAVF